MSNYLSNASMLLNLTLIVSVAALVYFAVKLAKHAPKKV
jgi:hypothetical protein